MDKETDKFTVINLRAYLISFVTTVYVELSSKGLWYATIESVQQSRETSHSIAASEVFGFPSIGCPGTQLCRPDWS